MISVAMFCVLLLYGLGESIYNVVYYLTRTKWILAQLPCCVICLSVDEMIYVMPQFCVKIVYSDF